MLGELAYVFYASASVLKASKEAFSASVLITPFGVSYDVTKKESLI
jgi:hypothetical protein